MKSAIQKSVLVNRSPVLTLWAAVVAKRLGYNKDEALSLGKAVAGLNAQSKGRKLGIYKPKEEKAKKARVKESEGVFRVEVCGRPVPVTKTQEGIRAVLGKQVIDPDGVQAYLEGKFGDNLSAVEKAMTELAKAYKPKQLTEKAYDLYEQFRQKIPSGQKGWGAKGELDLELIGQLNKKDS